MLADHLGSTTATTDAGGSLVSELRYKAWGEVRSGSAPTHYTYTGQYSNIADFGLMYYNARWYDPGLSRFTSADTIIPNPADPQGWDRFSYVKSNPISFVDPTGHKETEGCQAGDLCDLSPTGDTVSGDENEDQTDVTDWLANTLTEEQAWLRLNQNCAGDHICLLRTHWQLFGNYGRYDVKVDMLWAIGYDVVLCGRDGCRWLDYSQPGNILYGYLSAGRGVPQALSWAAAGYLEIEDSIRLGTRWTGTPGAWLDNPGDKAAVDFGYALYSSYGDDITLSEFQEALTMKVLETFQAPSNRPLAPPLPASVNQYGPGSFLNPVEFR